MFFKQPAKALVILENFKSQPTPPSRRSVGLISPSNKRDSSAAIKPNEETSNEEKSDQQQGEKPAENDDKQPVNNSGDSYYLQQLIMIVSVQHLINSHIKLIYQYV